MDVTIEAQVLDLLQKLKTEQGLTLIYISHDLAAVSAICERVMVFNAGCLVEKDRHGLACERVYERNDPSRSGSP